MTIDITIWDPTDTDANKQLEDVLTLHKANKATLGALPDQAFKDRARHRGLLIGYQDSEPIAYLLYDTPGLLTIKLVHLCVESSQRGNNIPRRLVSKAISLHPHRAYLKATCRDSYGLDHFWRSLGMSAVSEATGRGLHRHPMTTWQKRINVENTPNLFELALQTSDRPVAALDTNVIIDLYAPSDIRRDNREQSLGLATDAVTSAVEFTKSPEVNTEIARLESDLRQAVKSESQHITTLPARRPDDTALEDRLISELPPKIKNKDDSLSADVQHIADAIHARANYFITNDDNVINARDNWSCHPDVIKILRPHELIIELIPSPLSPTYHSNLISVGELTWSRVERIDENDVQEFHVYRSGAKLSQFRRQLRELLARPFDAPIMRLIDSKNRPWALIALEESTDDVMSVPLLRTARGSHGMAVSHQIIRFLRNTAWERERRHISITDPSLSDTLLQALDTDGFAMKDTPSVNLGPLTLSMEKASLSSREEVIQFERTHWPSTVVGGQVPAYVIPIKPHYASQLLGHGPELIRDRRLGIGLSRELVYFSNSRNLPKDLPARVLWYISGSSQMTV